MGASSDLTDHFNQSFRYSTRAESIAIEGLLYRKR